MHLQFSCTAVVDILLLQNYNSWKSNVLLMSIQCFCFTFMYFLELFFPNKKDTKFNNEGRFEKTKQRKFP